MDLDLIVTVRKIDNRYVSRPVKGSKAMYDYVSIATTLILAYKPRTAHLTI